MRAVGAGVPHADELDLAVAQEPLRLRALAPPDADILLDAVERFEGPVEIIGKEPRSLDAVGHEREGEHAAGIILQAACAGEFCRVPELGPVLRTAIRETILAIGDDVRESM